MADNRGDFEQPNATNYIIDNVPSSSFIQWIGRIHLICISLRQSGITANRPTSTLWIGRRYYDTTLGYPVWVHSYAGGVAVWHNAAGAPV